MFRFTLLFSLMGLTLLFQSCDNDPITCIRVSSSQITESRDVRDFKGIAVYEHADLILTQGSEYALKLSGPQNVVELTSTTLVDDYLVISSQDCFNGDDKLTIEVTAPEFELIYISEKGKLETKGAIKGGNIQIEFIGDVTGSAVLEMDSVVTTLVGKGQLNLSGTADYHEMEVAVEFSFNGFPLITNHTVIRLSGTGACEVTANEILDVSIDGAGKVYYKGSPDINSNGVGAEQIIDSN